MKLASLPIVLLSLASPLHAQPLSVAITQNPTNLHDFFLDVLNMEPGVFYGVAQKAVLDSDPFNSWAIFDVFPAPAPAVRYEGTASQPQRTYLAVNLDNYAGGAVHVVSSESESVVSGDLLVQVQVTDILPLFTVEVFVGEILVGNILPGQGGAINLPTYWFPNGEQQIWVRVVNQGIDVDTDDDGSLDSKTTFASWGSVTVTFSNEVYMENFSPLYSAYGVSYFAAAPHDYTFEVFRLNGELLNTQSGTIDGSMAPPWNFTDLSGNPVNDAGYIFSLTVSEAGMAAASATGGGIMSVYGPPPLPPSATNRPPYIPPSNNSTAAAGVTRIVTTNFFDKGVTVGEYVISYGEWAYQPFNDWYRSMNDALSYYVNVAAFFDSDIIGEGRYTHTPVHADFTADPYAIRKATETNDLAAMTNALADVNVGSWLWEGHSFPEQMIAGDDGYLSVVLSAKDLAAILGNRIGPSWAQATNLVYTRRLMSTFITGCAALNGTWGLAVGTPPGVDQVENLIRKSVFLGFAGISKVGTDGTKVKWIVEIHNVWIDGFNYDTPIKAGLDIANIRYPAVVAWGPGLHGFRSLIYSGDDSR
jgi:hypothetical protein